MLLTEHSVLSRVHNGVLQLRSDDRLTPSARDLLKQRGIMVQEKKAEAMTHLNSETLVSKGHPRIALRGKLDTLQAELLLLQKQPDAPIKPLQELLQFIRELLRAEVLDLPAPKLILSGMNEDDLHERSHQPKKYYGVGHFLPSVEDDAILLHLNRLRALVREAELCSYHAFIQKNGKLAREDILCALNRLSSALWVLCLARKGGKNGTC